MRRTPSLRSRLVVLGVIVVVVVVATINAFLYLTFREQLRRNLDEVLDQRVELVRAEGNTQSGSQLATRLTQLGIRATVETPDGATYPADPPSPRTGRTLPRLRSGSPDAGISRPVALSDGSVVTVFAKTSWVDEATQELLLLDAAGLVMAVLLGAVLLQRTSVVALRPLHHIAESARRTSRGQVGERLRPDQPSTALGQLATAYDEMVDNLETAVKQASDAQTESELHYLHLRQVIETAQAGFVEMNAAGLITEWNRKAEEMFGWTEKEVVGRSLAETLVPPALRPRHVSGLKRFLDTGEHRVLGKTVEFEALHRDGHLMPVEINVWVTYVGDDVTFNALLHDVTERRRGEEAISRLASIVESAQEAIFSTSLDGTILTWNFGAERLYGYTAAEVIGRDASLIVPPDRPDEAATVLERVGRGEGVARYETVRRRKDGSEVDVAVTNSPIFDVWGEVVGASVIARDITEQRQMALAIRETMTALEYSLDEARESEEHGRRFLADAAHQLRSPVAGVRACAETLLMATGEQDRDALLADLVRETARAGRLISSLLRLARVEQGTSTEARPCDIVSLCRSEVERTRLLAPRLEVTLDASGLPRELPIVDAATVTEIVSNLLDNARRHAATTIGVSVNVQGDDLRVVIADDGPGIPEEAVDKVFERFVSLDGKGGSGLGLPIARGLARNLGGDLVYDGKRFVLTLRCRRPFSEDLEVRGAGTIRISSVELGRQSS